MAAPQQPQQNPDNSLAMLWGLVLSFVVAWAIWFFLHDWIAYFFLKWRLWEARCLAWIIPSARHWVFSLQSIRVQDLQFSEAALISSMIGHYLRIPISLILLSFAASIYMSRATLRFKQIYNMRTLVDSEMKNWVHITPIAHLNLIDTPIDSGVWAMASTPFQFAQQRNLVRLERIAPTVATAVTTVTDHYLKAQLKREAARHTFTLQLGDHWQGVESLPMPTKALFAIFSARAARDRVASDQLLAQISRSAQYHSTQAKYHTSHLNFIGTEHLLNQYQHHPLIREVVHKHGYVLTVMASMLLLARQDGVIASSEFLWLKPCDRTLWFMLNCVGRQTAYAEVAGPFSHWIAERALGHKLQVPMIDTAVDALEIALREVRLSDDTSMHSQIT